VLKPDAHERLALWRAAFPALPEADSARLAVTYRLSAAAIAAEARAQPEGAGVEAIEQSCRIAGRARLEALASRVRLCATFDDLVLPEAERAMLNEIVAQMRARPLVDLAWPPGSRGLGLAVLFAGESGTGKTMAAEAIACELGLDLYRVDLAQTVSKYIGETAKNLRTLFDAAEESGAVLLFDEADALFGKRSEVRDAHDRYANIETGYLLQRLETYSGLAILTSNLRHSLDPAFQRRLRFVVSFPFPDQAARIGIWQRAFPEGIDTRALDPARLGQLMASGGAIRVVALNAAFAAVNEGIPVSMRHVLAAAHLEAAKRERPLADAETRTWL
jgi:SpoVK/Ycf46/Vps4 family AAA+-type ATPase